MFKQSTTLLGALLLAGTSAAQVSLDLEVSAAGAPVVSALPGQLVGFEVVAELSGDPNLGLAMFAFDLDFDGGSLAQLTPSAAAAPFVAPLGLNNPAGFGGTLRGGDLLQVGGAMNTINNQFATAPVGAVVTGIGLSGPEVLASGAVVAPSAPGAYRLRATNLFANALDTPAPAGHWEVLAVEPAQPGDLTILVLDCGAVTYCEGKPNSAGCTPRMTASGAASLGGASTLTLGASEVVNGQFGLFVYGTEVGNDPAYGGTLCVGGNVVRLLEPGNSGGSGAPGSSCEGGFSRVIDSAFLLGAGLGVGDEFFCQWVYRDPLAADGSGAGLTDAAAFVVCP